MRWHGFALHLPYETILFVSETRCKSAQSVARASVKVLLSDSNHPPIKQGTNLFRKIGPREARRSPHKVNCTQCCIIKNNCYNAHAWNFCQEYCPGCRSY